MEKISIQTTYTQVSLYARYSSSPAKKSDDANAADAAKTDASPPTGDGKGLECGRSKDGDTFSLSIEARTLRISETYVVSDEQAKALTGSGKTDASQAPAAGAAADAEPLTGGNLVHALMDAVKSISGGHDAKHAKDGKRRHHFPRLADPQDVVDNLLAGIRDKQAASGESKAGMAADIKQKLADWKPAGARISVEYQEFRSEVHMKLTQGLDAWAKADDAPPAAEGSGANVTGAPASGFGSV